MYASFIFANAFEIALLKDSQLIPAVQYTMKHYSSNDDFINAVLLGNQSLHYIV